MSQSTCNNQCKVVLFILMLCECGLLTLTVVRSEGRAQAHVPDDVLHDLFQKYREVVSEDNSPISLRRFNTKNREFEIHVQKLKEVNGFKAHNLKIEEKSKKGLRSSKIYINNPVESKVPHSFLNWEEFKNILTERIKKQREELVQNRERRKTTESNNQVSTRSKSNIKYAAESEKNMKIKNTTEERNNDTNVDKDSENYTKPIESIMKTVKSKIKTKETTKKTTTNIFKTSTTEHNFKNVDHDGKSTPAVVVPSDLALSFEVITKWMGTSSFKNKIHVRKPGTVAVTPKAVDVKILSTESTITESTTTKSTTKESSTSTTTKFQRVTLGRPAVFMGA